MKLTYQDNNFDIPDSLLVHHAHTSIKQRLSVGNYEEHEIALMKPHLDEDTVMLELGGSLGILSCIMNSNMPCKENHVVVEAHPLLVPVIENHREMNDCKFKVHRGLASHNNSEIDFHYNEYPLNGNIFYKGNFGKTWTEKMRGTTPIDLEVEYGMKFNTLSCDIEGGEFELLEELYDYFKDFKLMVVEFHNWNGGMNRRKQIENKYSQHFQIVRNETVTKFIRTS